LPTEPELPDQATREEIAAAVLLWDHLAAFAWGHARQSGRGALLLHRDQLLTAAERKLAGKTFPLMPTFLAAADIPRGDDFRPRIAAADPAQSIMLIVARAQDEAVLLELQTPGTRPTPPACFELWTECMHELEA